ncbi:SDR family oxidoreductase [Solibacillus sp. FSL W7-1464]|uniref:SDR family NAD(P)-dependent oxidoreductase n=1 Tax=Solibacillus sp. FSL W7-1464 TaxID=2921706 RepID=UPI0030F50FD7
MELLGKVALVTGGGRGIGKETALLLASKGAKVAVCARNEQECTEVQQLIETTYNVPSIGIKCDVSNYAQVQEAVAVVTTELGPIDILINNAGAMALKPFTETTPDEWIKMHDINVHGPYYFCYETVPSMIERRTGAIINISSIWGTKGGPNRSAYISSKHAVIGFSKALGEEMKPYGIRVNAVCPGPVDTRMTDELGVDLNKSGWLEAIDIANVIVDLVLPKSRAITATSVEAFGYGAPVGLAK